MGEHRIRYLGRRDVEELGLESELEWTQTRTGFYVLKVVHHDPIPAATSDR